ncbi:MAG: glucosaminidase domain-containing protein [Clostridiales bacterium]|jgi:hypothetical protein|nr:glucosaminidase domain-containing protein [Clostridiales bacterium]
MKRHLFSLFILIFAVFTWIVVMQGGKTALTDEPQQTPSQEEDAPEATQTVIKGESEIPIEAAKAWAISRGATEDFVSIADEYWRVGELMGIRADVLYAQAAKETAFGNYTGIVTADMNNWAGIKTVNATGDTREDHQFFNNAETGVQAHFNHMAAYVGIAPLGDVHPRYYSVMTTAWSGTIEFVEQLGGKWAPSGEYGESVVNDYLSTISAL